MSIIVFRLCSLLAFASSLVYHTHMFQLNGYHKDAHMRWSVTNAGMLAAKNTFALAAFVLGFFSNGICIYLAAFFMLVCTYAFLPREKAKKPLVFTARVKRMLLTSALIALIVTIFASFTNFETAVIGLVVILTNLVLMLADIINSPVEKAVKQRYINQAKRILRERKNLTVIGITGSYGKTSTKYFLTKLLEQKYNVLMTPASYNTPMGVVKTVRESLKPSHEIFVCEMGAKYKGDIKEICDIVNPDIGIITAIGPQHLESFKSIDAIIDTKFELADALSSESKIYLNFDNEYIRCRKVKTNAVSYGTDFENADCKASIISVTSNGTEFEICYGDEKIKFSTRLLGKHNVQNLAGCICLALDLGVNADELKIAVSRLEPVPHRLQMIDAGDMLTIIDDAFNANPFGTHAALEVMSRFDGLKIIVTPGMIELGEKQSELNFKFGEECAAVCDYIFLVGTRVADDVYGGASKSGVEKSRLRRFTDVKSAVDAARSIPSEQHKYILLENDLPDNY